MWCGAAYSRHRVSTRGCELNTADTAKESVPSLALVWSTRRRIPRLGLGAEHVGHEIWGDMGRYGEIWEDMGRYGARWGDMGRYGEIFCF